MGIKKNSLVPFGILVITLGAVLIYLGIIGYYNRFHVDLLFILQLILGEYFTDTLVVIGATSVSFGMLFIVIGTLMLFSYLSNEQNQLIETNQS